MHGTLYIGVTSNLVQRLWQHKNNQLDGFTKQYAVHTLVHYEVFDDISNAIIREKQLKRWHRKWKANLIQQKNPNWLDLYPDITA